MSPDALRAFAHFAHDCKRIVQGNADRLSMSSKLGGCMPPVGRIVRGARMSVYTVDNADSNLREVRDALVETSRYRNCRVPVGGVSSGPTIRKP